MFFFEDVDKNQRLSSRPLPLLQATLCDSFSSVHKRPFCTMNASSSSPPVALSPSEATLPAKRGRTFWRPLLSCGGALLLGAVLVQLLPTQTTLVPQTLPLEAPVEAPMMLLASQIVPVRVASPGVAGSNRTLRGQWKMSTDATGRAPVSGQVARWVVEPGTRVEAGDKVMEISTGGATRPAPVAESRQNSAEREQIAAADGQNALAQRLTLAQSQLVEAQERVARAKEKVAQTRVLVRRLQAGEKIPVDDGATKRNRQRIARATPEPRLSREQQRAMDAADEARTRATSAKSELDEAQKLLGKAQKQSEAAAAALAKAEADYKVEKTTADVLQNARADADDAASALKAAQTRADVARRTYATRQETVNSSEAKSQNARSGQQSAPPTQPETASAEDESGRYLTADQAATLVGDALRESKAATRQAERIHARVDDYQRQVNQSSQRIESASKGLQKAQESVMESVPRAVFTASRAPVAGTITWISRLAREVGAGESVFGISRGRSRVVRFEDKSGAWKALKVGQILNAAPMTNENIEPPVAPPTTSPAMPSSVSPQTSASGVTATPLSVPVVAATPTPTFSVRLTRIVPPTKEGEAAQIEAVRVDGIASDQGPAGVQAELPAGVLPVAAPATTPSSQAQPVVVPLSVILPRDGASFVAVVKEGTTSAQPLTMRWRAVQVERETPFDVEIKSGLQQGERVIDHPTLLLSRLRPEENKVLPIVVETLG